MKPRPYMCRECGGEGHVPENEDKPVRRRWSYTHGTEVYGAVTCPRCKGEGWEPEENSTEENDQ